MNIENRHDSQRGWFAYELYQQMKEDKDIWLVCLDLGYRVFDAHFRDFPDRCINPGAAEQAGMGLAVGLAMEGKKPFVYSIAPFLLARPYETIRNYIHHERIPVRLVASGRGDDYSRDGFSHFAGDDVDLLRNFKNVFTVWPNTKEQIPDLVGAMVESNKPWYVNLTR